MPFQDIDEVTTTPDLLPPAPSRTEKLLRRIFIEDWSLKLLSLAIAIVLWLLVTGQNPASSEAGAKRLLALLQ